jgi:hypothetical protein
LREGCRLGAAFIEATRLAMIDFGFGGLIHEFEQHLGRVPTKILLLLVFLAIAATCVNIVLTIAVIPLFKFVTG